MKPAVALLEIFYRDGGSFQPLSARLATETYWPMSDTPSLPLRHCCPAANLAVGGDCRFLITPIAARGGD